MPPRKRGPPRSKSGTRVRRDCAKKQTRDTRNRIRREMQISCQRGRRKQLDTHRLENDVLNMTKNITATLGESTLVSFNPQTVFGGLSSDAKDEGKALLVQTIFDRVETVSSDQNDPWKILNGSSLPASLFMVVTRHVNGENTDTWIPLKSVQSLDVAHRYLDWVMTAGDYGGNSDQKGGSKTYRDRHGNIVEETGSERWQRLRDDPSSVRRVALRQVSRPKLANSNRSGAANAHFKFRLSDSFSDLDLNKYQIYPSEMVETKSGEQCVIFALRQAGVSQHELDKLSMLGLSFRSHASSKDLRSIAAMLERPIRLTKYTGRNNQRDSFNVTVINPSKAPLATAINLATAENHAFVLDATPYTIFYLDNKEWCDNKIDGGITWTADTVRLLNGKNGVFAREGAKSHVLVKHLLRSIGGEKPMLIAHAPSSTAPAHRPKTNIPISLTLSDFDCAPEDATSAEAKRFPVRPFAVTSPKAPAAVFALDIEAITCEGKFHKPLLCAFTTIIPGPNFDEKDYQPEDVSLFVEKEDESCITGAIYAMVNLTLSTMDKHMDDISDCEDDEESENEEDKDQENPGKRKKKKPKPTLLIYVHNLQYDITLIEQEFPVVNVCKKGTTRYSVEIFCNRSVKVLLVDSLKLLPFGLASFTKTLGLPDRLHKQEFIVYEWYDSYNLYDRCTVDDYLAARPAHPDPSENLKFRNGLLKLLANHSDVVELEDHDDECTFLPGELYIMYLNLDVVVLAAGVAKLQYLVAELGVKAGIPATDYVDIHGLLTITAIGKHIFSRAGVYLGDDGEPAYGVSANLRTYIHESVVGGRIFVGETTATEVIEESVYNDARSLYPTANTFITGSKDDGCLDLGFPAGRPSLIPDNMLEGNRYMTDKEHPWWTVTVRVTQVRRKQSCGIPSFYYKTSDGRVVYSNTLPEGSESVVVTVDQGVLMSWITFHDVVFTTVQGVRWDAGPNSANKSTKMGDLVRMLYNERVTYKRAGNTGMYLTDAF